MKAGDGQLRKAAGYCQRWVTPSLLSHVKVCIKEWEEVPVRFEGEPGILALQMSSFIRYSQG